MDHGPAHGPKFTKINGPCSGPWAKIHKNRWTMVRPMGQNSQKSMDHGPAHGPKFTKIHGPWSGPWALIHGLWLTPKLEVTQTLIYKSP